MRPSAAAASGGRRARRDWPALRRLLDDSAVADAANAVGAAQRATVHHSPLGHPADMTAWNGAVSAFHAAAARLAKATCAATPAVVAFVRDLDDTDRRALAGPVRAYARELLGRQRILDLVVEGRSGPLELRRARASLLLVAGAGCFNGADATAAWLARRDLRDWSVRVGPAEQLAAILEVLQGRDRRWLADVAERLAGRLRPNNSGEDAWILWATTAALVRHAGIDPPASAGFVRGWVLARTGWWPPTPERRDRRRLVDQLRDDPLLDALSLRLFDVDEVGDLLRWGVRRSHPVPTGETWPGALAQLAAEGRIDRAALLDRCLGRLLRGGTLTALTAFVALHETLDPTLHEQAARVRDYARLLPDAPPAVAELAQRALRRLDDAGRLDVAVLAAASRAALFRPERKVVRAQLGLVDAAARRRRDRPDEVGELLAAATVAFGHEAADLQERAVSLVRRHAARAPGAARGTLHRAASTLPDDLRRRLTAVLGTADQAPSLGSVSTPATVVAQAVSPPSRPVRRALPPPIGTPAELAEELAALLHADAIGRVGDPTLAPVAVERVLAALVAFAYDDRDALHKAIAPVLRRYGFGPSGDDPDTATVEAWPALLRLGETWYWHGGSTAVALVAAAAGTLPAAAPTGGGPRRDDWRRLAMAVPGAGRFPQRSRPRQAILYRFREIGIGLLDAPVPTLLATPTTSTGEVDPAVLLDTLARAEDGGWQPWELDLQLALLRLPHAGDPALLARARRLRSPAGRRFADRLAAGAPPEPVLTRLVHVLDRGTLWWSPVDPLDRTFVIATKAAPAPAGRAGDAAPNPSPSLMELLFDLDPAERLVPERWLVTSQYEHAAKLHWPALLPGHRDLIAAHLLPALSMLPRHEHNRGLAAVLPLLAEGGGQVGLALTLALAHGLGARDQADRAAAADALVILAGRGQLDGAALGRELAGLVTLGLAPVQRLVEPLRDVARAGASAEVWAVVASALPRLLPPVVDRAPQRLAALVALGSETAPLARGAGPGAPLPELPALAALAGRGGSSRLAAEARRLHHILTAS